MRMKYPAHYDPSSLMDVLCRHLGVQDDIQLAQHLQLAPSLIENIRLGRVPVSASLVLLLQESTGLSVEELRHAMGDRRNHFRLPVRLMDADGQTSSPPLASNA